MLINFIIYAVMTVFWYKKETIQDIVDPLTLDQPLENDVNELASSQDSQNTALI